MVVDFNATLISSIRDGIVMSWTSRICSKCQDVEVTFGMYYSDYADSDDEITVQVVCGYCVRGES